MEKSKKQYFTSDLMKTLGIGRNTLRLYEDMGLLTGLKRTLSGYRTYSEEHLVNLKFVLAAKKVGFTLNEVKSLLSILKSQQNMTCGKISKEISGKVSDIDQEIELLMQKKTFLNNFLKTCSTKDLENKCDVVNAGFEQKACCS